MTYYTNSNEIRELMTQLAEVRVKSLVEVEEKPIEDEEEEPLDVKIFIFDELFHGLYGRIPDIPLSAGFILRQRPDWGGLILDLMKKHKKVFLFSCGEWVKMVYDASQDNFRFFRCSEPLLDADRSCLISTSNLTYSSREAIRDLMEPIRFGQALANRMLRRQSEASNVKSLFTLNRGDYKELCLKMEALTLRTMHQRDLWKDRFFYEALHTDRHNLCEECKETMRLAFYVDGDETAALKWRPDTPYCDNHRNCKYYCMMSLEDRDDVELMSTDWKFTFLFS